MPFSVMKKEYCLFVNLALVQSDIPTKGILDLYLYDHPFGGKLLFSKTNLSSKGYSMA
jgi:hypothetical protein